MTAIATTTASAATTYTITYKANGGTGTMSNQLITCDYSIKSKSYAFSNPGYSFTGWYKHRASDNTWFYTNGSSSGWYAQNSQPSGYYMALCENACVVSDSSSVDGDTVMLYAQWSKQTPGVFTVVYNANHGTGTMSNTISYTGSNTVLSNNAYKCKGYNFGGWYAHRNYDNTYYGYNSNGTLGWYSAKEIEKFCYLYNGSNVTNFAPSGTVTLYANWTPIHFTIKYDANGGTGKMDDQIITYNVNEKAQYCTFRKAGFLTVTIFTEQATTSGTIATAQIKVGM